MPGSGSTAQQLAEAGIDADHIVRRSGRAAEIAVMAMESMPAPDVLDHEAQLLICHDDRALIRVLREVCAYGRQLWNENVRSYLLETRPVGRAGPLSPADDSGRDRWSPRYSSVLTTLAVSRGGSG